MFLLQRSRSILLLPTATLLALPLTAQDRRAWDDFDIVDQVEDELLFDTSVPANDLDVTVDDGVVVLVGEVDTMLAEDRAVRLAESVRGVTAVVDEIDVMPNPPRADWQVENAVEEALLRDAATDSYELEVLVADGTAIVSGQVDSWQEKALSEKVIRGVRGVVAVDSSIRVARKGERPDPEIAADVRGGLRWDALVDHLGIDVAVTDGVVQLSGVVGSAAEKRRARSDAWIAGVTRVDDADLKVEAWADDEGEKEGLPAPAPDAVRDALHQALLLDSRVHSDDVRVYFDGLTATLRGEVHDLAAKRAAATCARNTVGVHRVENRLKVRPGDVADASVEDSVRAWFRADPLIERYALEVEVRDGTARLTGRVDDVREKLRAEQLAARTHGVREIENRVDVVASTAYVFDPYVDVDSPLDRRWYFRPPHNAPMDDDWLRDEVEEELFWSPYVDSDQVEIRVEDGTVTLSGEVDSRLEERMAIENAWQAGATHVRDRLSTGRDGS